MKWNFLSRNAFLRSNLSLSLSLSRLLSSLLWDERLCDDDLLTRINEVITDSRCQRCLVDGIWSKILTTNIEFIFRWIITMYRIKFYTFIFVHFLVIFLYIKNVFAVYLLSNKYKYLTFNIIVTLLIKKKYNYFGIILTRFFIFNVDFHVWYTYCVVRIVSTYNGINSYLDQ